LLTAEKTDLHGFLVTKRRIHASLLYRDKGQKRQKMHKRQQKMTKKVLYFGHQFYIPLPASASLWQAVFGRGCPYQKNCGSKAE